MSSLSFSPLMNSLSVHAAMGKPVPGLVALLAAWRTERRRAREDRELWALAQLDSRVMTDLVCASNRQD